MADNKHIDIDIENSDKNKVEVKFTMDDKNLDSEPNETVDSETENASSAGEQEIDVETEDSFKAEEEVDELKEEKQEKSGGIFAKLTGNKKEKAKEKLESLENELAEQKDKNLRLFAEFDNYKKRTAKERIELFKTAGKDVVIDMLSVLDDFDRATKAAAEARENDKPVDLEGFNLIHNKIKNTLNGKGLKEMETNGTDFDPDLHDAITEIPAPSDDLKGKIVDTIEKGYYMNDVIIRHAKVVIGK